MIFKAIKSRKPNLSQAGLVEGRLKPCGTKANCASSTSPPDADGFVEPLQTREMEATWKKLKTVLKEFGFEVLEEKDDYIHATHKTKWLGFVDDLEFHRPPGLSQIDMRSVSRVGYYDFGANRKRLKKIRQALR